METFHERRWKSRDDLSLYARDYAGSDGAARLPVICLHGLTRNSKDFEDVAPAIARGGRRVLALDIRGRGRSDRDPDPRRYVPTVYARDVLELMDRLGIARAIFLGTSMGGIIAMAVAGLRSRAVAASVLNDVGPAIDPKGVERIKSYAGQPPGVADWAGAADYVRRVNAVAFPDYRPEDWQRFAHRTFRDVDGAPTLDYDPGIMIALSQGRHKAPGLIAWLLFRRLARHRPTLLLRGALSDLVSADIAERMRRQAPGLEMLEIPRVGHAPMLTEPEAAAALKDFLERVD